MVGAHRARPFGERRGQLLGHGAGLHIDDAGAGMVLKDGAQMRLQPGLRPHRITDVGPVEAGDDQAFIGNAELAKHIL